MKFDLYRTGGWLVSSLCLASSMGFIANRHGAFVEANRRDANAGLDLQHAREEQSAVGMQPSIPHFATVPRESAEETKFITDLRQRAHAAGVTIARWNSKAVTYEKPKEGDSSAPKGPDGNLLIGITKVSCDIALDGPYDSLRNFIGGLWASERLLTMSKVDWIRTEHGSELSMTLGRYVDPAAPEPTSTGTAKSGITEGTATP